jgi:hypothetical protein
MIYWYKFWYAFIILKSFKIDVHFYRNSFENEKTSNWNSCMFLYKSKFMFWFQIIFQTIFQTFFVVFPALMVTFILTILFSFPVGMSIGAIFFLFTIGYFYEISEKFFKEKMPVRNITTIRTIIKCFIELSIQFFQNNDEVNTLNIFIDVPDSLMKYIISQSKNKLNNHNLYFVKSDAKTWTIKRKEYFLLNFC